MEKEIVIIGAGLTGLTLAFLLKQQGRSILLLEKETRTGGQIRTFREGGFCFESGPNTGVISCPEVAELFQQLAPNGDLLETAREESKRRLIWKGDRFEPLPSGLLSAIRTPLFSLRDKLRILGEPFRAGGVNPDETVGELTERRLGKSFLQYAVDPFLSGVYAGDPMKLVTRHALPKLYRLEQEYGSFIRGSLAKAKQPVTARDKLATKQVFSTCGGLESLIRALTKAVGEAQTETGARNIRIHPRNEKWEVRYETEAGTKSLEARYVITTVGAYALPALLPFLPDEELMPVSRLHYAPVMQVSAGFSSTGGVQYQAFGGLIPSCEKKRALGILFPSACFRERAPREGALFSFFLGGVKQAELLELDDEAIRKLVIGYCHEMLKIPDEITPDLIRIFRHPQAIPQYDKNSDERLRAIRKIESRLPGLILAGNLRDGIGMADRIRQAVSIANQFINI